MSDLVIKTGVDKNGRNYTRKVKSDTPKPPTRPLGSIGQFKKNVPTTHAEFEKALTDGSIKKGSFVSLWVTSPKFDFRAWSESDDEMATRLAIEVGGRIENSVTERNGHYGEPLDGISWMQVAKNDGETFDTAQLSNEIGAALGINGEDLDITVQKITEDEEWRGYEAARIPRAELETHLASHPTIRDAFFADPEKTAQLDKFWNENGGSSDVTVDIWNNSPVIQSPEGLDKLWDDVPDSYKATSRWESDEEWESAKVDAAAEGWDFSDYAMESGRNSALNMFMWNVVETRYGPMGE
jgi:hypothetical protein